MDYKEETKYIYDIFPDYFDDKFGSYVSDFISDELEYVCKLFPNGAKILDLGSGPGNHALFFKNKGFDVLCLDISDKMLEKCRQKGLKTVKKDIENLDFNESKFDVLWAYTSLLHIKKAKVKGVISQIHKILKKDGYFGLSLKEGVGEGFVEFKYGGKRWFSLYKDKEIRDMLNEKFTIIKNWRINVGNEKVFLDYLCKKK